MAKAKEIPGLDAGMSYARAAALTVAVRGEEVFEHSTGVLDMVDIERVHDMRVATRRLRAVLEIYAPCFPHDELRPVLRDVKQLADALGARRDPDVELLALEQFAVSVGPDERPGVEHFVARTRAEQEEGNRHLVEVLDEVERSALRGRIARLATLAERPSANGADVGHAASRTHDDGDAHERQHHAHDDGDGHKHGRHAHDDGDAHKHERHAHADHGDRVHDADAHPREKGDAPGELLADRVYGLDGEPA